MNTTRIHLVLALSSLSLLGLAGCGAEAASDPEDLGAASQAFGEASCATATADANPPNGSQSAGPSSSTYSNANCYKSYIIDYTPISTNINLAEVSWNDSLPSTSAACGALFLAVERYSDNGSGGWTLDPKDSTHPSFTSNGTWNASTSTCTGPVIDLPLTSGQHWRISTTARTSDSSGAATQKFWVQPLNIN